MGAFDDAKGKLKQAAGDLVGDPDLQREGEAQEAKGQAERDAADARRDARAKEAQADVLEAEERSARLDK